MIGAFATPVFVIVGGLMLLLLCALPPAMIFHEIFDIPWSTASSHGLWVSGLFMTFGGSLVAWLRWRSRAHRPIPLSSPLLHLKLGGLDVGGKSRRLHQLQGLGFSVAPGWLLPPGSLSRLTHITKRLAKLCRLRDIDTVIVRSSFANEDGHLIFSGIFTSVPKVDSQDTAALQRAIEAVLDSSRSPLADRYARRLGAPDQAGGSLTVLVQEHLTPTLTGVICSYDLKSRRADEVLVEAASGDQKVRRDVYSWSLQRWRSTDIGLDSRQRRELLDALFLGETLLRCPAVMEFGVVEDHVVVFQLRPAPSPALRRTWIRSGIVYLNPTLLPTLPAQVLYGDRDELLAERLNRSLAETAEKSSPAPKIELAKHLGRHYVEVSALLAALRWGQRRYTPITLVAAIAAASWKLRFAAHKALTAPKQAKAEVDAIRHLASLQADVHDGAERARALAKTISTAVDRAGATFAPLIPWHRLLRGWASSTAHKLQLHRDALHAQVLDNLAALPNQITEQSRLEVPEALRPHLTLAEWLVLGEEPPATPDLKNLEERKDSFEQLQTMTAPLTVVDAFDDSQTAEERAASERSGKNTLSLNVLVPGRAEGIVTSCEQGVAQAPGDFILIVPDSSTEWLPLALEARAVLFLGGQQALSHLALMLIEAQIPTLAGLDEDEAEEIRGKRARLDEEGTLFILTS